MHPAPGAQFGVGRIRVGEEGGVPGIEREVGCSRHGRTIRVRDEADTFWDGDAAEGTGVFGSLKVGTAYTDVD
ncbi:hypothetical protein GCM10023220_25150 [Streptomyces ziwulingensis]|uniref:Uncharacterized protein n=1 Tax=Streptomyces ziwulingensis TaxID=1045501 RepID=A0ABP9BMQ6_9ACTN